MASPTLRSAPSPKQFADAWTRSFATAVRDAGGKDGRLSLNEAKKIAKRTDGLALYGDNAVNYLERTGQKSVSIEKLIGKGHDYAFALAQRVSGGNNRISLVEGNNLPEDLRADFMALRGRAVVGPKPATLDGTALVNALDRAATLPDGTVMDYMSESDYPVLAISVDNPTGKINASTVLRRMADTLSDGIFEDVTDYGAELTAEMYTKPETTRFFSNMSEPWFLDEDGRETANAFGAIADLLSSNLKDMRVVKIGPKNATGDLAVDDGLYAYAAVGQTQDGKMAGIYFGAVET